MPIIDVIFILIIFGFLLFGLWFGLIYTLGSNIGFFLGIFVASRTYLLFGGGPITKIAIFIIIFLIIGRLVGLAFFLINKIVNIIKIIPFTKTIDRVLGAIFGLSEGILIVSAIVFIINSQNLTWFIKYLQDSDIAPIALKISKLFIPFITDALIRLNTIM